jgi:hypothetical protein
MVALVDFLLSVYSLSIYSSNHQAIAYFSHVSIYFKPDRKSGEKAIAFPFILQKLIYGLGASQTPVGRLSPSATNLAVPALPI